MKAGVGGGGSKQRKQGAKRRLGLTSPSLAAGYSPWGRPAGISRRGGAPWSKRMDSQEIFVRRVGCVRGGGKAEPRKTVDTV